MVNSDFISQYIEYLKELSQVKPHSYLKVSLSSDPKDTIYFYDGFSKDVLNVNGLMLN